MSRSKHARVILLLAATILAGCGGGLAPVTDHPAAAAPAAAGTRTTPRPQAPPPGGIHTVTKGDTLLSIAWRYGLDYRQIAKQNQLPPPYKILVGQKLKIAAPASAAVTTPASGSDQRPSRGSAAKTDIAPVPNAAPDQPATTDAPIRWQWPTQGQVVEQDSALAQNGIAIRGVAQQPIYAAAAGEVVYSGSGLVGYGKLIIIQHNDIYLSAYAHNEKLLVAEGVRVRGGQQIAEMGSSAARQVLLHFEIRRNGKPVSPLQYLPRR